MPIYEFYCPVCHAIYSFFSRSINTAGQPSCPKCGREKLSREVSRFAAIGKQTEAGEGMDDLPIDEAKMERAMTELAADAARMNEDDPSAAAQLMRKMSDMTGLEFNEPMREAIARMERGEDPEQIEREMGTIMDDMDPFVLPGSRAGRGPRPPARDEKLYDM